MGIIADNTKDVFKAMAAALRTPPRMSTSEWADKYRILPIEESEPGPWRTSRVPFMREIMDKLSPSDPTERIILKKAAQVSGTECGHNFLAMTMHLDPGRFLFVLPTVDTARRHSKSRIAPMIQSSPVLRKLVRAPFSKMGGNTHLLKEYPGGFLIITGSNSAAAVRSTPIRYLMTDEIDEYPLDLEGQGDTLAVCIERTRTYGPKRKIFIPSTPTIKGISRIDTLYEESDQRSFHVPCPYCEFEQKLIWAYRGSEKEEIAYGVVWPDGEPWNAKYKCANCGELWDELLKSAIVAKGRWIPAKEPSPGLAAGYHISALYSPWITWGEVAMDFVSSKDDPVKLKAWVNLKLGEAYEDTPHLDVSNISLLSRCEIYDAAAPTGVALVTAAVDVQMDRLEVLIVGWGRDEEAWDLWHEQIYGDPSGPEVWELLDDVLTMPLFDRDGRAFHVAGCAVDSGYLSSQVYNFVRPRKSRNVWAIRGRDGRHPIWPKGASPTFKSKTRARQVGKVDLWLVGIDSAKEAIYQRLKYPPPGAGRLHFPVGRGQDYFDQLQSEVQKKRISRGQIVYHWELKNRSNPNEILDLWVYNLAALHGLKSLGIRNKIAPAGSGVSGEESNKPGALVGDMIGDSPTPVPSEDEEMQKEPKPTRAERRRKYKTKPSVAEVAEVIEETASALSEELKPTTARDLAPEPPAKPRGRRVVRRGGGGRSRRVW